jgi:PAS domain S-box-containing protein
MRNHKVYKEAFYPGRINWHDALYQNLFDESPDAIFLLQPDDFMIIDCNIKALQLFQVQDKAELIGMEYFSLYDSEPVEFSKINFIDTINKGMEHSQELAFRTIKGNVFWGRCSIRKVETSQDSLIVFRVRLVVDYMKTAEMLASLVKHTAKVTGYKFFSVLTELLSKSFGVSMTMIARIDPESKTARIIQGWHKTQKIENSSFDLETSSSLNVLKGYTTYYPSNLRELFPEDKFIRKLDMESYLGTPVFNTSGEVCGLLVLMDNQPMEEIPNSRYILALFASRAGAELERIEIEQYYRRQIEKLTTPASVPLQEAMK